MNTRVLFMLTPSDPVLLAEIEGYKEAVVEISNQLVGSSHVYLDGRRTVCRLGECNLGE